MLVGRIFNSSKAIKAAVVNNGFIRTFGIVDENGDVDIESLATNLKTEMQRKSEIAAQKLVHDEKDYKPAVGMIEEFKKTRVEPSEYMMEFRKEKHEDFTENYARAKCMIDLFNK